MKSRQGSDPAAGNMSLLVVDDETPILDLCQDVAQDLGLAVYQAEDAAAALRQMEVRVIDMVLLDLRLPGTNGMELLSAIKRQWPNVQVAMMSGLAGSDSAQSALEQGATDFLSKPFKIAELKSVLEGMMKRTAAALEHSPLQREKPADFTGMAAKSQAMVSVQKMIAKAATTRRPILIRGEGGAGKKTVAQAIHFAGPLRDQPFVEIDCGASAAGLEQSLFGQSKSTTCPRLDLTGGATIFLHEIGRMPLKVQHKLLEAIAIQDKDEKNNRSAGRGRNVVAAEVRIVASTSQDLQAAAKDGKFLRPLLARLSAVSLVIPALRERREDIPLLVEHFLRGLSRSTGVERLMSRDAMKLLLAYDWPDNVRELEECLQQAVAASTETVVTALMLPVHIRSSREKGKAARVKYGIMPLREVERQAILGAVDQLNGDKLRAARLLGIGKTTLYRKLREYGFIFTDRKSS